MFLVCSHLKKVRSIAYKCGTNKADPAGQLGQDVPVLFFFKKNDHQAFGQKKRYSNPHPKKNPEGPYIYNTSKNFSKFRGFNESCAGEVLCAPLDLAF